MTPRVRLLIAAALFVGWLGWLGFTALTKSRAPVVSRAQAAGASVPVVAELTTGEDGRAVFMVRQPPHPMVTELKEKGDRPAIILKVAEQLTPTGPEAGAEIGVTNLPSCTGYTGPGKYLLLLNKVDGARGKAPGVHARRPAAVARCGRGGRRRAVHLPVDRQDRRGHAEAGAEAVPVSAVRLSLARYAPLRTPLQGRTSGLCTS